MAQPIRTIEVERFYTSAQFMELPDDGRRYELVNGVIKEMSQPGEAHALVQDNLTFTLGVYVRTKNLGRLLPAARFDLGRMIDSARDTVRAPDLAFLPNSAITWQSGAIAVPPGLAIEILSPNDRPGELRKKLLEYQSAGWDLVWVINPDKQKVEVYRLKQSLKAIQTLRSNEILDGADVIPGFNIVVKTLFQ